MKVGCDIEDDKRRAKRIRETIGFDKILVGIYYVGCAMRQPYFVK